MEQDLIEAKKYLSQQGYGSETNYTTNLVTVLLANYAQEQFKKLRLADVSRCFGEDDLRHVYEDIDTNYQSFEDWFKVYTSPI